MDSRLTGGLLTLAALLTAAGCMISQDENAGRACAADTDCPEFYVCGGLEGQRFCQVIYPPPPSASDGGTTDGGVVPTYCRDVQPILAANCTSNCHGADRSVSGHPEFRLDQYDSDGGVKGAKEMASEIKLRAFDRADMPPSDPKPSASERAVLARWATGGAPFCDDGGTP